MSGRSALSASPVPLHSVSDAAGTSCFSRACERNSTCFELMSTHPSYTCWRRMIVVLREMERHRYIYASSLGVSRRGKHLSEPGHRGCSLASGCGTLHSPSGGHHDTSARRRRGGEIDRLG